MPIATDPTQQPRATTAGAGNGVVMYCWRRQSAALACASTLRHREASSIMSALALCGFIAVVLCIAGVLS